MTEGVTGWLFDAYAIGPRMVFWLKTPEGRAVRITDDWAHSIYVGCDSPKDLRSLAKAEYVMDLASQTSVVPKRERITDYEESQVLQIRLKDSAKALTLAKRIESQSKFGQFRLYNVDVLPAQAYFYENELFPLAFCDSRVDEGGQRRWALREDGGGVWSTTYKVPELKSITLTGTIKKTGKLPRFSDKIHQLKVKVNGQAGSDKSETTLLESTSEVQMIHDLTKVVNDRKVDPDIIFTVDGDAFFLPYLAHRAAENNAPLILGRDPEQLVKPKKEVTSYFSYGKINFKPTAIKLKGRLHLDVNSSFAYSVGGLHGLYEVARICRLPIQNASRASIGKCLSSLQFYNAYKQNLLVPWKPVIAEHFKTREELIIADRGGLIFEPEVGVHEQVAEFDFVSLYPNIMHKKNLSAETVRCKCCPDSTLRVPELGYNICQRRTGLIPTSLDIVLRKRREYKRLKQSTTDAREREIYDARQTSLKWILVTSFGYLGFSNAKFGRIDAHIAVCAFDREILIQAADAAEEMGFRVLHGIVDSLWVKMEQSRHHHYVALKQEIEKRTGGFEISFEGMYKWLVFLPSNTNANLPVANRYFGAFEDGTVKVRGIEARRHDTPPLLAKCQSEMLSEMAKCNDTKEVREALPVIEEKVFCKYVELLKSGKAPAEDLVFSKRASKAFGEYEENRRTEEADARRQLAEEGRLTKAGEFYGYVITNYNAKHGSKATPLQIIESNWSGAIRYDSGRYIELLERAANTITRPFGHLVAKTVQGHLK